LDKAEVAPQSAAAEAWVAAEAVETSGDCDNLGESSAPPIVPIVPVAPPANTDSGNSGSGDSGSSGDGQTGGSVVPSTGMWTLRYSATGKASCLGTQTVDFPVSLPNTPISVSRSGSTLMFGIDALTQVQPNVYSGLIDFSDGSSVRFVLSAVSPTQFVGEATANVTIQGEQCSATIPITVTKN
jgi:hypothetical protein